MKEIIAGLIFLCGGIYSRRKLNIFGSLLTISMLLIFDYKCLFDKKIKNESFYSRNDAATNMKSIFVKSRIIFLTLIFILGMLLDYRVCNHKNKIAESNLYVSRNYEGVICELAEGINNYKAYVKLDEVNEKILVYLDKTKYQDALPGFKVTLKGILREIDDAKNLGQYNDKQNKREKKVYYDFYGNVLEIEEGKIFFLTSIYKLKRKLCDIYDSVLDEKSSKIIKAMVLGEKSFLDEETKKIFKEGGVFHILAISGLHVSVVLSFAISILNKLKVSKRKRPFITIPLSIIYMILSGMSVSTIRATLMNAFSECSLLFDRDYNSSVGLCLAGLIMLIFNPSLLFSMSFVLSFLAIVALKCRIKFKGILKSQSSNISVFLFMLPILVYNFYTASMLSTFANIFILPLTPILLILSFLILLFYFLNINVAYIASHLIRLILTYFEEVLMYLSNIKGFHVIVGKCPLIFVLIWYILYYLFYKAVEKDKYLRKEKREKKMIIKIFMTIFIIFMLIITISKNYDKSIFVTFINVDHGDSSLIFTSDRSEVILIDGGGKSDNKDDTGKYNILPYLLYEGIDEISLAVVTHADRDHIKGIIELTDLVRIKEIAITNVKENRSKYYYDLIDKCIEKNISIINLKAGDNVILKNLEFDVLSPLISNKDLVKENNLISNSIGDSINNSSLVILFNIYDKKILFTGDIEKETEEKIYEMITNNYLNIDCKDVFLMKVPHHGSDTSSSDKFINLMRPTFSVVSGDKNNIKKFNKSNVFKYRRINANILNTYNNGMIKFNFTK